METTKIYCLTCPITLEPKYVGQTSNSLKLRLSNHMGEIGMSPKNMWIKSLFEEGLMPGIMLLETTSEDIANIVEIEWIDRFRKNGFCLLNSRGYKPKPMNPKLKVKISRDLFIQWKHLKRIGDMTELGKQLSMSPAKVLNIINSRSGTQEQIDVITKFYESRKLA